MITIDSETYGSVDLRECGAYVYAAHPDTRLLVVTWAEDDGPVQSWSHLDSTPPPRFVGEDLVAYNSGFDKLILERFGLVKNCRWHDAAAQGAMCALPRGLDKVAAALGLPVRKDKRGSLLIRKLCVLQRPSKSRPFTDPVDRWPDYKLLLGELVAYGEQDIIVAREVYKALPKLPATERAIWLLTERINDRGICIDLDAVRAAERFVKRITGGRGEVLRSISGFSHTQVGELLNWVNDKLGDRPIESLDKATVASTLRRHNLPPDVREALEIRQELAKSSVAKLGAMLNRVSDDGRVRGNLIYHGAGTGRWTGAGVQVQNIKSSGGFDMDHCIAAIHGGDAQWIDMVYGMPVPAFISQSLRGMLIAAPGKVLAGADYAAVEVRVLLWLARDPGLEVLANGGDLYVETAKTIGPDATRQLGKQVVLGAGYGCGAAKFRDTCAGYGMDISEELAQQAITAYRTKMFKVPRLWKALESAAIAAIQHPGTAFQTDPKQFISTRYQMEGDFLTCTLPSERKLYFAYPQIEEGKYGPAWSYMGVDSVTKAWRRESTWGGKQAEQVTQAVSRDITALAMLRLEEAGYPVVLSVHDEIVVEVDEGSVPPGVIADTMCALPDWAAGLPLKAEEFSGRRYS